MYLYVTGAIIVPVIDAKTNLFDQVGFGCDGGDLHIDPQPLSGSSGEGEWRREFLPTTANCTHTLSTPLSLCLSGKYATAVDISHAAILQVARRGDSRLYR